MGKQDSLVPRIVYETPDIVPGLRHIGYDVFADARPSGLETHSHPGAYEVCYIRRGSLQWLVSERPYDVGPGDLFMTLPDEMHGGRNGVMDRCELFWVSFDLDVTDGCGMKAAECALLDRSLRSCRMRVCPGPVEIVGHFERILRTLSAPEPLTPAVVRSSLVLLLAEVRSAYLRAATGVNRPPSPRIAKAMTWMQRHLADAIALDAVAAQVALRPSQFRAVFMEETGFSPREYLTQVRIARAKEILGQANRSITSIALATGFTSSQYFATAFRRITGFTPRDFRKRLG